MATRFKATDLKEMIRAIVREEMTEVVTKAINEVLSERYLKQLAETARPRGVGPTLHIADGDPQEEEDPPHMLANDNPGIYYKHPGKHDDSIDEEEERPLHAENIDRNAILSMFFEGTKPLTETEAKVEEGVPLEMIEKKIAPASNFKRLLEAADQRAAEKKPIQGRSIEAEEARIRMMREQLEKKVV